MRFLLTALALIAAVVLLFVLARLRASESFLQANGTAFSYAGQPVALNGSTMYPLFQDAMGHDQRGSSWALSTFPSYIDYVLNLAQSAHFNTIRPTDYLDGSTRWDDSVAWSNMDYLLSQAQRRHMFVILDLSAYRTFLERQNVWPYDPNKWTPFLQFVGRRYANSPVLAFYSIAGEIPAPHSTAMAWNATADQLVRFFSSVSSQLHTYDGGHHLISTGGLSYLNFNSGIPWQTLFSLPHVDMATIHVYSDADRTQTVPMVSSWAQAHGRPFVVEEFGFQQSLGDKVRAAAYAHTYQLGMRYHASGMVFWNLGPEIAPTSYDVNPQTPEVWHVVQQHASPQRATTATSPAVPPATTLTPPTDMPMPPAATETRGPVPPTATAMR